MTRTRKLAIREQILLDYEQGRLTLNQARERLTALDRELLLSAREGAAPSARAA
ncbi:hypothetical protein [Deinococcus pimensis]|uniref:hypothetical protein n=1 Tax=Deinococcus pimensis TaxID=309888 RepID=UPI0004BABAB1|nr:hypothetical protein [Deinococcus pimensis]